MGKADQIRKNFHTKPVREGNTLHWEFHMQVLVNNTRARIQNIRIQRQAIIKIEVETQYIGVGSSGVT